VNQQTVGFGMHSDLKDTQANCIRAKIPLYQLVFPAVAMWEERIWGPFNVNVTIEDTEFRRANPRIHAKWFTKQDAYITYSRVDKKTAVAWMPDDPFWHNRLFLMDSEALLRQVTHKRTHNEMLNQLQVKLEVDCLREALCEEVPVWSVIENRRMRGDFESKDAAETWISDLTAPEMKVINGVMTAVKAKKRDMQVVVRKKIVRKPQISELAEKEKYKHEFGWTQCTYFTEQIQPAVREKIKEKMSQVDGTQAAPVNVQSMIQGISEMTAEQKSELRRALFGGTPSGVGPAPVVPEAPEIEMEAPEPEGE